MRIGLHLISVRVCEICAMQVAASSAFLILVRSVGVLLSVTLHVETILGSRLQREAMLSGLGRQLHRRDEAHALKHLDDLPRQVKLAFSKTVLGRILEGVVIVVPAFPKRQETNPPIVARLVAGSVGLLAPEVRRRVDEPGDVVEQRHAERAPAEQREASDGVAEGEVAEAVPEVVLLHVAVERLLHQVSNVAPVRAPRFVNLLVKHPAQVGPVEAFVGRVRVERRLRMQVVVAVVGDPLDGPALHRHGAAVGRQVLKPLWALERAVCELPMVRISDADSGHHIQ
mmetsp:Transcript_30732/g.67308  ORF Transcript_30732/g.67308 Transcript_30732/m.67308 type:complete len:285 (-) Transcript_30732:668-1522(-)